MCLDANLHDSTIDLIQTLSKTSASKIVFNSHKRYTDVSVDVQKIHRGRVDNVLEAYQNVLVKDGMHTGKRVIGHISSLSLLLKIEAHLKKICPSLNIRTYHGKDHIVEGSGETQQYHKDLKQQELADVNTNWTQYDVLLYTGTISSGVDFQTVHFDSNISCFSKNSTTADLFMQGLMRCRNLVDKKISIFIEHSVFQRDIKLVDTYRKYQAGMEYFNISTS